MRGAGIGAVALVAMLTGSSGGGQAAGSDLVEADIPTKGCPTSGMVGDEPPPVLAPILRMHVPAPQAAHLAYYRAAWPKGVLGPRDWTCSARSGSDGIELTVAPPGSDLQSQEPSAGPRIELRLIEGGTSGRFAAAAIVARVFPTFSAFARRVAAEHPREKRIVFRPFPTDELTAESDRVVIYRTPGGHGGLGTSGDLARGALPIGGFVSVGGQADAPQVTMLAVRLPKGEDELSSFIVAEGMEESVGAGSRKP